MQKSDNRLEADMATIRIQADLSMLKLQQIDQYRQLYRSAEPNDPYNNNAKTKTDIADIDKKEIVDFAERFRYMLMFK